MYHTYVDWTLEDPPRPFYVGKGNDQRIKMFTKRNPRHTAIRKAYGIRREIVLSTIDENQALQEEVKLIAKLKTDDEWGANFTSGGDGVSGYNHSEETKKKISHSLKGRQKSMTTRMNMRAAQSGRCVKQFLLDGTLSATYESQSEAERKTGVSQSNIYKCCRKKLKSAGGFIWRYEHDQFDPKLPKVLTKEHRNKLRLAARNRYGSKS